MVVYCLFGMLRQLLHASTVTSSIGQLVIRLTTHKLASMFGNYPSKQHVTHASVVLGERKLSRKETLRRKSIFNSLFRRHCIFGVQWWVAVIGCVSVDFPVGKLCFLFTGWQKSIWSQKWKLSEPLVLSPASSSTGTVQVAKNQSDDDSQTYPCRVESCSLCISK